MQSMQAQSFLQLFLVSSLWSLPSLIVAVVGGVIILKRFNHHPRASWWALLGFGLLFLLSAISPVLRTLINMALMQGGAAASHNIWLHYLFSTGTVVLHAVTYTFLLLAVLADRQPPSSSKPASLGA